MADENKKEKELTPEEKERARGYALKNLKSKIPNIAAAYLANKGNAYGKAGNSAVDQYVYRSAIDEGAKFYSPEDGKEIGLLSNSLFASREDGEEYSGTLTEKKILKTGSQIFTQSLAGVKVKDILELIGSKEQVSSKYAEKYIGELLQEKASDEEKELANTLFANYTNWVVDGKVSEALASRTKDVKKGLETLLAEEPKKTA